MTDHWQWITEARLTEPYENQQVPTHKAAREAISVLYPLPRRPRVSPYLILWTVTMRTDGESERRRVGYLRAEAGPHVRAIYTFISVKETYARKSRLLRKQPRLSFQILANQTGRFSFEMSENLQKDSTVCIVWPSPVTTNEYVVPKSYSANILSRCN